MKAIIRSLCVLILCAFSILKGIAEDGLLTIYFVDVGQADSTIITCDGDVLMIDGGNVADSQLIYSILSNTLGIRHIDYMIATHPHEDHVGGLAAALNACSVDVLFTPVLDYDTKAFHSMMKYAQAQETEIKIPKPGNSFKIGSAKVDILGPLKQYRNTNDLSIVCKITYGHTSFLFGGDVEWEAEHDLVEAGVDLSADVLKVNHHGSETSTSYVFLREVMPTYAIISVGANNSYGHPSDEVLSRLEDAGAIVMRTDQMGTIICVSDGQSIVFQEYNSHSILSKPWWTYSHANPIEFIILERKKESA